MQFDAIGRNSRLTVQEIEKANADDGDGHVGRLKGVSHGVSGIEFGAGLLDARQQRAGGPNAGWVRNLDDHGVASSVGKDQVVVGVALQFVLGQGLVELKDGGLGWLDAIVGRQIAWRWQRDQRGNCGLGCRLKIDQTNVGVGAGFDCPAFQPTGARGTEWG